VSSNATASVLNIDLDFPGYFSGPASLNLSFEHFESNSNSNYFDNLNSSLYIYLSAPNQLGSLAYDYFNNGKTFEADWDKSSSTVTLHNSSQGTFTHQINTVNTVQFLQNFHIFKDSSAPLSALDSFFLSARANGGEGYTFMSDQAIFTNIVFTPGSPVPIPEAIWFMSSGLLGLMGFSRKNKIQSKVVFHNFS